MEPRGSGQQLLHSGIVIYYRRKYGFGRFVRINEVLNSFIAIIFQYQHLL
jgi:hypothetical protein